MRNCKGFFLVEMLLSLSIWVLMTTGFIPIYLHVSKQSAEIEEELKATHLLYEVAQGYLIEGIKDDGEEVARGKNTYKIVWEDTDDFGSSEVCVQYENVFKETVRKCETIE